MTIPALLEIRPVVVHQAAAAIKLLLRSWPAEEQAVQGELLQAALAADGEKQLGLAAYRGPALVGVVWAQLAPGRSAGIYPPELLAGEEESTATALLEALDRDLVERGVHLAQALLPSSAGLSTQRLLGGGYQHAADLLYLVCTAEQFPDSPPPLPFTLEPVDLPNLARLERLLEATYEETLDCPAVDGVREPADVLASYQAGMPLEPRHWLIALHAGEDVGCLLLADHPRDAQMEIVYLGVTPAVRGRGWGIELTRHAQWLARQASRKQMVLAVDAENGPAHGMYATCGFWVGDRRSAYVKSLRRLPAPNSRW